MNNSSRPPSPSRFQRITSGAQKKKILDGNRLYLHQDLSTYQNDGETLRRTPSEKTAHNKQHQEQASAEALRQLKQSIRQTCQERRDRLYLKQQLHHNGYYLRLLRLKQNNLEKQSKWDKFVTNVIKVRIRQSHSWIDRKHSKWMANVISNSNPFELAKDWPEGSRCAIDPLMSPYWVMLKPPLTTANMEAEASLRKHLRNYENALEAAYYNTLGIAKPKPSMTTHNTRKIRTTTTTDSVHTASPLLSRS